MLIDSPYFTGERNIPNLGTADGDAALAVFISKYERKYLQEFLGYELSKKFREALINPSPAARYTDILFGTEFIGLDGYLKRWNGLVSLTEASPVLSVGLPEQADLTFTVGITTGAPAHGSDTYNNTDLQGKTYKVTQRAFGPLEALKADNSNVDTADIEILDAGGFKWLNSNFSQNDKYFISLLSNPLDVSAVPVVPVAESPIADYVYFYWVKDNVSQTQSTGEKRNKQEHGVDVSPKYKMAKAWNDMVEKNLVLRDLLITFYNVYPEWQMQSGRKEMRKFITKINPHF